MSALNKTVSEIWGPFMNFSLHLLNLSPNCHYDHVLFFRPSLWLLKHEKGVLEFAKEHQFFMDSHIILVVQKYWSTC